MTTRKYQRDAIKSLALDHILRIIDMDHIRVETVRLPDGRTLKVDKSNGAAVITIRGLAAE